MLSYFAFGSNMSQTRLASRVGPVRVVGRTVLHDHEHRFNKRGADGTAKGNIVIAPGCQVHGVLYRLTRDQLDRLSSFEGGYRRVEVEVEVEVGGESSALTFVAINAGCDVGPSLAYLRHYAQGMLEHGIEPAYARGLLAGQAPDLVAAFERAWDLIASNA